jgi:putative transposase
VIEDEKASYPIKRMCELLKASRPGFYRWRVRRGRRPTASQRRRAELDAKVAECHVASDGMYRAPWILADLRAGCERVSRNTVAASLRCPGTGRDQPRRFAPAITVVDLELCPKTLCDAVQHRGCSTGCGPRISPACAPGRAGCMCAPCVAVARGGGSAGLSTSTCTPISPRPR